MSKYCYNMMCDVLEYKTKFLNPSLIQLVKQELEYHSACQTLLAKLGNLEEKFRSVTGQEMTQRVDYDPYKFIRGRNLFSANLNSGVGLMEQKSSMLHDMSRMTGDFQYGNTVPLQHYQVGNELITAESVINKTKGNMMSDQNDMMSSQTGMINQNIIPGQTTTTTTTSLFPQYEIDKNLLYPSQEQFDLSNSDDEIEETIGLNQNLQNLNINQPLNPIGVTNTFSSQQPYTINIPNQTLNTGTFMQSQPMTTETYYNQPMSTGTIMSQPITSGDIINQPLSTGGIESYTNRVINPGLNIDTIEQQPLEENLSPKFQGQVSPRYKQGFSFQESNLGQGANIQQMPITNTDLKRIDQPQINLNQNTQSNI